MALKVKLVRSVASRPQDQKDTVRGLGLKRLQQERLLQDTPAIRGMVAKVSHLVTMEVVDGDAPVRTRKGRKKAEEA
jgi:large subunit ribosomal protein L30